MKRIAWLFPVLLAFALLGCGGHSSAPPATGGGGGNPPPAATAHRSVSSFTFGQRGYRAGGAAAGSALPLLGPNTVQAASSIALAQSFTGVCNLPPNTGGDAIAVLYGLGQNGAPGQPGIDCASSWFTGDPSLAAASATQGQVIVGDGTLGAFTCWATEGSAMPAGVSLHVWVLRAGAIMDSGLACSLQGNGYQTSQSTSTFSVLDGDRVIVTAVKPAGDTWVNLNAVFDKVVP